MSEAVEWYDSKIARAARADAGRPWARTLEGLHCSHCGEPLTVCPIPGDDETDEQLADAMYDLEICAECVLLGLAALAYDRHGNVHERTRAKKQSNRKAHDG